ncbi:Chloroplastic drought-induced stress protein of 32 kD [Hibiscus syriacus]|uniref:Chloroplastic drought-induced stress protein of 32 kD n=2 Tax=Hibiscus syriacus TaxID=106335 RepID=A0A6A2XWJ9_HIBSY|nr:Chloroplastic drought-induced stress protein of 32 kD [Hibiscus syriacus]
MILKFLPKAVSAVVSVGFQNPPFSPSRDKRAISAGKGLLHCPIVSIIPDEARRKAEAGTMETQEPTSPKVSCIGQIKHKKNIRKAKRYLKAVSESTHKYSSPREIKKQEKELGDDDSAPSLGQVKRFASGSDGLASFDWTANIAEHVEADQHRDFYSYEEEREHSDLEEEVMVPFTGLALQPRKEINIWKRRATNPPTPLQLKS